MPLRTLIADALGNLLAFDSRILRTLRPLFLRPGFLTAESCRGRRVRFRFTAPRGFHGTHGLDVEPVGPSHTRLRHVLEMRTTGRARVSWPLVYRPLHDALLEDALDRAERAVGGAPNPRPWSRWVRLLRWVLSH